MNLKKVLYGALTSAMVMGMSMSAFATTSNGSVQTPSGGAAKIFEDWTGETYSLDDTKDWYVEFEYNWPNWYAGPEAVGWEIAGSGNEAKHVIFVTCENDWSKKVYNLMDSPEYLKTYIVPLDGKIMNGAHSLAIMGYNGDLSELVIDDMYKDGTSTNANVSWGQTFNIKRVFSCDHADAADDRATAKAPTCTEAGKKADNVCPDCDRVIEGEALPANGHSFTNYVSNNDATCTADGTKTAKCDNCDATDTVADTGSATGHLFTSYVSNNDATCTADGTKTAKCDNCDATDTIADTGSAKGHTEEVLEAKAATCTETGLTEGKKCSVCKEVLVPQESVAALGHDWVDGADCSRCGAPFCDHVDKGTEVKNAKDATCTEKGYTGETVCKNCGEVTEAGKDIDAKGHTEEKVEGKAATCTEEGLTDGTKCSVCGETVKAQEKIAALGHTEEKVEGKAATCKEEGLTDGIKCSVCGETVKAQEKLKLADHAYKGGKCEVCGDVDVSYKDPAENKGDVAPVAMLSVLAMLGLAVSFKARKRA